MKNHHASEFFFQIIAFLVVTIVVHSVYLTIIRPQAQAIIEKQKEELVEGSNEITTSVFVIIKDIEQESCLILMFWAIAIMGFKGNAIFGERKFFRENLVDVSDEMRIVPEDSYRYARHIKSVIKNEEDFLLPKALVAGLFRFSTTRDVQDTSEAIKDTCETEAEKLDSELAIIRYIVWAVPSIGFIGTVRGISQALSQAHQAVQGDIFGVTASLGVAFNSTFVALIISLLIMFLMHQVQLSQERLVLDTMTYCNQNLIHKLET